MTVMTAKAKATTDSASVMAETRKLRVSIGIFIVAAVQILFGFVVVFVRNADCHDFTRSSTASPTHSISKAPKADDA